MTMGGHGQEDRHWEHTLRELARHVGADGEVTAESVCVDKRRQWSNMGNVWHNAGIRSGIHLSGAPFRAMRKPFKRGG